MGGPGSGRRKGWGKGTKYNKKGMPIVKGGLAGAKKRQAKAWEELQKKGGPKKYNVRYD
jgi:hypothetical protein